MILWGTQLIEQQLAAKNAEIAALKDELSACTESPGGCGYWREAANLREQERDALKAQLADHHAAVQHVTEDGKTTRSYITSDGWAMVHAERLSDLEVAEERNAVLRAILAPLIAHADRHDYAPPYMLNVQQCREIKEAVNGQ